LYDPAQMIGRRRLPWIPGPHHQAEVANDEGATESEENLRQLIAGEAT
jgi:hypothetical protein